MLLISFIRSRSKLILVLSIVFFLVSLLRHHWISSSTYHEQSIQKQKQVWQQQFGQIVDIASSSSSKVISAAAENLYSSSTDDTYKSSRNQESIKVYTGLYSYDRGDGDKSINALSKRLRHVLPTAAVVASERKVSGNSSLNDNRWSPLFEFVPMNIDEQLEFLKRNGNVCFTPPSSSSMNNSRKAPNLLVETYQKLISEEHTKPIAQELWKFCALSYELEKNGQQQESGDGSGVSMVAYIDIDSPLLDSLEHIIFHYLEENDSTKRTEKEKIMKNYAVLGQPLSPSNTIKTIHGSLLILQSNNRYGNIAQRMVQDIVHSINSGNDSETQMIYTSNPLYISQNLFDLISTSQNEYNDEWVFLKQRCHSNTFYNHVFRQHSKRKASVKYRSSNRDILLPNKAILNNISCPSSQKYCCDIITPHSDKAVMVTKHVILPYQLIPIPPAQQEQDHDITNDISKTLLESPYIVSIEEEVTNAQIQKTNNFLHSVAEKHCLPTTDNCKNCMAATKFNAGTCKVCAKYCNCFCDMLCQIDVEEKVVSKILKYSGMPLYRKDPTRLIPRIIHQTWFEEVTQESYPNFSRLTESWKQHSGWEYRFYDNDDEGRFLSAHFPPEVREAYDDIIPGAFKADLFRYCVLFIHGGVYADIDVHLTSKLDIAIDDDIGFMIPLDKVPGSKSVPPHVMCLWNGFMAAAPGHPILAEIIETVVNNIRNRFTSIDVMNSLCPKVDLSISTTYDLLFTSGPCILGATVNKMFGKHPQTSFHVGDLDASSSRDLNIPGRVVILDGNKADMGAFRFTFTEKNLIVAATDMPDFEDKPTDRKNHHYSLSSKKGKLYGLRGIYKNSVVAHEKIRFELSL